MSDEEQHFGILGRKGRYKGKWDWYHFDYAKGRFRVSVNPVFPWDTVHMAQHQAAKLMEQEPDLWTTQIVIQPDGWGPITPHEANTTTGGGNW